MNIVSHIFRKDVRHLRWLLGAWFVLVLLQTALLATGVAAWHNDAVLQVAMSILGMLVPLLKWVLLIVLVPLLIQDEPLTGHTAFWFTRPIGRMDLLASKARFLVLLIILPPVLAEFATLAYYRVAPGDLALALPELVWDAVVGLVPVVALAVVTSSFARYAVTGVSLYVGLMVVSFLWQMARMFTDMEGMMAAMSQPSLQVSRGLVVGGLTLLLAGGAIVHQYRTRRTRRTVLLLVVCGLASVAVSQLWKWDFMDVPAAATPEAAALEGATAHIESRHASDASALRPGQTRQKEINAVIACDPVPPGHFVSLKKTNTRLVFSDGQTTNFISRHDEMDFDQSTDSAALADVLNPALLVAEGRTSYNRSGTLLSLPADLYDQRRYDQAELTAELVMRLQRYDVLARLPLRAGEEAESGTTALTISDVLKNDGGCTVVLGQRSLNLTFKRQGGGNIRMPQFNPRDVYALVNRRLEEAYLPERDFDFDFNPFRGSQRLVVSTPRLSFLLKENDADVFKSKEAIEDWLSDAEVWWIGVREAGSFRANLREKPFQLDEKYETTETGHVDTNALAALDIVASPSREQAHELVKQVYQISRRQRHWRGDDPQVAVLVRVGPENIEELLKGLREYPRMSFYLVQAIDQLANDENKALVLSYVKRHPDLLRVVQKKGWMGELDPALVEALRKSDRYGSYFDHR